MFTTSTYGNLFSDLLVRRDPESYDFRYIHSNKVWVSETALKGKGFCFPIEEADIFLFSEREMGVSISVIRGGGTVFSAEL